MDRLRNTYKTACPAVLFQPCETQATVTPRSFKEEARQAGVWGGVVVWTPDVLVAADLEGLRFLQAPGLTACQPDTWAAVGHPASLL